MLRPELAIGGALLVAPADAEQGGLPPSLSAFAPIPRIPLPFPSIVAASRNDPWITQAKAASLARGRGAGFVDLGCSGHMNRDSGFGPWPFGRGLLASLDGDAPAIARVPVRHPPRGPIQKPAGRPPRLAGPMFLDRMAAIAVRAGI